MPENIYAERLAFVKQLIDSGELNRGEVYLRVDACYCFMGLLCEAYRRMAKDGYWTCAGPPAQRRGVSAYRFHVGAAYGDAHAAPPEVIEFFGLDHAFEGTLAEVIQYNDTEHGTHDQVLTFVRSKLREAGIAA